MLKRIKGINIVAFWMVISSLPAVFDTLEYGVIETQTAFVVVQWIYCFFMIVTGVGLAKTEEWARKLTIWLFGIFFAWVLYTAYIVVDAPKVIIESLSLIYDLSPLVIKTIVVCLFVVAIIWPIIVIQFLTHPQVKRVFRADFDPVREREDSR